MNREELKKCYDIAKDRAIAKCEKTGGNYAWAWEEEFADAVLQYAEREVKKFREKLYTGLDMGGYDRGAAWCHAEVMNILRKAQNNDGTKSL